MKLFQHNEPLSALTHFIAILLSIAGLVLMVISGVVHGQATHVVGFAIFGASLILLYTASFLYHLFPKESKIKDILRRIDHAMIFLLIAGTYTPLSLTMPQRGWGWSIFGIIWGLAIIGFLLKIIGIQIRNYISISIYLAMGWLIIVAISPVMQWLDPIAVYWMFAGGIFYSVGCIFFALDDKVPRSIWFGMHEIFHIFVIMGSFSHFWLMLKFIAYS